MTPLLEVRDLEVEFSTRRGRVRAVRGLTYTLAAGEALGIVGESGSGKSVGALAVLGLLPKHSARIAGGSIRFRGQELVGLGERELRPLRGAAAALVFQDPLSSLNPALRIGHQITEQLEAHRRARGAAARRRAVELLDRVGISDPERRARQYPHELSGGMRQRAMIAMALSCEPALLVADEPTTALDVTIQAQILELLAELRETTGMSVLLITHDLGVVAGYTDRVAVMYAGRIVEEGATGALLSGPLHPYTDGLLRSIPRLDRPRAAALSPIPGMPPNLAAELRGCPFAPRCGNALDRCREQAPPFAPLAGAADAAHPVACWAPVEATVGR